MANTARKASSKPTLHAPKPAPHLTIAPAPEPSQAQTRTVHMIDDPQAPEFFTSRCCGFSIGQGNVTLTFESVRCDHFDPNGAMNRVVVGRIVMPIPAAQALVVELNGSLQANGLSPSRAVTAGMVPQ